MFVVPASIPTTGGGYVPAGAIWLDGSADYFSKTFSSSGDRDTYARSVWVKRNKLGGPQCIFESYTDAVNTELCYFRSNDKFQYAINSSDVTQYNYITTAVYRDTSAWMHILVIRNSTTISIYINGTQVTDFDTSINNGTTGDGSFTNNSINYIGRFSGGTAYFNS
jgi:hypothetical protein